MPEYPPAGERVIDREQELQLFRKVLARASGPCVITVQDKSGSGKSWLLELLEEHAATVDPPALTVREVFDQDLQLMSLVERIASSLGRSGEPLRRFEELNLARITYSHETFGLPPPPVPTIEMTIANSQVHDSSITGAEVAGLRMGWPPGHETAAMNACLNALLDDLRDLSHRQTVVLLLDQYERSKEIQQWLERALLTSVLHEADPFGGLIIVVASTDPTFPSLSRRLGTRSEHLLREIKELSRWEDEHIDRWLKRNGIPSRLAPAIRSLLDEGASLQTLRMFAGEARAMSKGPE